MQRGPACAVQGIHTGSFTIRAHTSLSYTCISLYIEIYSFRTTNPLNIKFKPITNTNCQSEQGVHKVGSPPLSNVVITGTWLVQAAAGTQVGKKHLTVLKKQLLHA